MSFRTPVVRRARRCARKPRSGPDQTSSATPDRGRERLVERRRPSDERQARAAVVDAERPGRQQGFDELPAAVDETARVPAGGAVSEVELDLFDADARADGVDRHPRLGAESRREREHGLACPMRQEPLTGQRLARDEPGPERDQLPGDALRDPEPAAGPGRELSDGHPGFVAVSH